MMKRIREWLEVRRERDHQYAYRRGYGFAVAEVMLGGTTTDTLRSVSYSLASASGTELWFDCGVRAACEFLDRCCQTSTDGEDA